MEEEEEGGKEEVAEEERRGGGGSATSSTETAAAAVGTALMHACMHAWWPHGARMCMGINPWAATSPM